MISDLWRSNIQSCRKIVHHNQGPRLVNVVSGSTTDQTYWQDRLLKTREDVFRADGETFILSSLEQTRKGNFLGSVNAWQEIRKMHTNEPLPPMILMNMVFGLGKRLSPFTQALANRKSAFPTPLCSSDQTLYLTTADIASFSATLWLNHLETNGFQGTIVKWGDEAVFPGKNWEDDMRQYQDVDGVRFIWQTDPSEDLAREKEWVEFDEKNHQMTYQYTRQGLDGLQKRLSERGNDRRIGVNLGSLGISYRLMEIAEEVFRADVLDKSKWVDWDPYTWIALSCRNAGEWKAEADYEQQLGNRGIYELEERIPDFFPKVQQMRELFRQRYGRLPVISVLDFGQPFWMDWGLHLSLRRSLEALTMDSQMGMSLRELFSIPYDRDKNGNILVRSSIPSAADVKNSVLVDTLITEPETVIRDGLVVAGRHRKLEMPYGGSALFCAANEMKFDGPNVIAFRVSGDHFQLDEGDRLTDLYLSDATIEMRTNESLVNYEGENYSSPVMDNPISFEEAARRMSLEDTRLVDQRWSDRWSKWLD